MKSCINKFLVELLVYLLYPFLNPCIQCFHWFYYQADCSLLFLSNFCPFFILLSVLLSLFWDSVNSAIFYDCAKFYCSCTYWWRWRLIPHLTPFYPFCSAENYDFTFICFSQCTATLDLHRFDYTEVLKYTWNNTIILYTHCCWL